MYFVLRTYCRNLSLHASAKHNETTVDASYEGETTLISSVAGARVRHTARRAGQETDWDQCGRVLCILCICTECQFVCRPITAAVHYVPRYALECRCNRSCSSQAMEGGRSRPKKTKRAAGFIRNGLIERRAGSWVHGDCPSYLYTESVGLLFRLAPKSQKSRETPIFGNQSQGRVRVGRDLLEISLNPGVLWSEVWCCTKCSEWPGLPSYQKKKGEHSSCYTMHKTIKY